MVDRDVVHALETISRRLENLEQAVRRLDEQSARGNVLDQLFPVAQHLNQTRAMFILEILRQAGLLNGIDVAAIEAKVTDHIANKKIPWSKGDASKAKYPKENVEQARHEVQGEYDWTPERFR